MEKEKTIEEKIAEAPRIKNVTVTFHNDLNYSLMARAVLNYIEEESGT
jgi:hypothetical protein